MAKDKKKKKEKKKKGGIEDEIQFEDDSSKSEDKKPEPKKSKSKKPEPKKSKGKKPEPKKSKGKKPEPKKSKGKKPEPKKSKGKKSKPKKSKGKKTKGKKAKGKAVKAVVAKGLPEGVTLGNIIDRSGDRLFVGTDYREVHSWTYDRSWPEILADIQHWTIMPFTMGIEQELIIAYADGAYPPGDEMVYRMKEIVKDAINLLKQVIYEGRSDFLPVPDYIKSKIENIYGKADKEKGYVMDIRYKLPEGSHAVDGGQVVDVDCFGRDGNVTAITYILELVTPPCRYVEELAYWASTLFLLAKTTLPSDLYIIASGINPAAKEYMRGLTQADHFHIGTFRNDTERAQIYCMLRNFIPHLIALTVNSPIMNNQPTDIVKIINNRITAPNCVRSLRLKFNESMLSSNVPQGFIPYLTTTDASGQALFLQTIQKASLEDGRMQDIFPFTDFGTIEFRVCDAQISICRRIGMAMLLQALAYKARKLLEKGTWVPDAGADTISTNRRGAYERGLISLFRPKNIDRAKLAKYDPDFAEQYLGPENDPVRYLTQGVQRIFLYLKDILKELNYLYSPFFKPLLQSVFGIVSYAEPPITEAEYQLSLYDYKIKNNEVPNLLNDLIYFTVVYCQDPLNNPLTGELALPKEMRE